MGKAFCLPIVFVWMVAIGAGSAYEAPKEKSTLSEEEKSAFEKYIAEGQEKETLPVKEEAENELLAPVAKPVVTVIEGVNQAVTPLLENKEIKDEKGETQIIIEPKKGKVGVPF